MGGCGRGPVATQSSVDQSESDVSDATDGHGRTEGRRCCSRAGPEEPRSGWEGAAERLSRFLRGCRRDASGISVVPRISEEVTDVPHVLSVIGWLLRQAYLYWLAPPEDGLRAARGTARMTGLRHQRGKSTHASSPAASGLLTFASIVLTPRPISHITLLLKVSEERNSCIISVWGFVWFVELNSARVT